MNKRQVISSLNKIAEELDNNGLYVEASEITHLMKKIAQFNDGRDKTKFHSLRDVTTRPSKDVATEIKNTGISQKVLDIAKLIKKENAYSTATWLRRSFNELENDFLDKVISKKIDPDNYDINSLQNWIIDQKINPNKILSKSDENYLQSSASRYFLEQINSYFKTGQITRNNSGMRGTFGRDPSLINDSQYKRLKEEINVNDNLSSKEKQYLSNILQKGVAQMMRGLRPQQVYVPFEN